MLEMDLVMVMMTIKGDAVEDDEVGDGNDVVGNGVGDSVDVGEGVGVGDTVRNYAEKWR